MPEVPFTLPPAHAAAVTSIAGHSPAGGTPTRPALEGAVDYATTWAKAHPDRKVVIVMATDGDPTGCTTNTVADAAQIATAAYTGAAHIPTFVIGIGSSLTSLDQIANSGGTNSAYVLDTTAGKDVAQQFSDALNDVRKRSFGCSFPLPSGADMNNINLVYTPPSGSAQTVPRVTTVCTATGGWTYDATSSTIEVCPTTCAGFGPSSNAHLVLGCPTIVAPIP
jgi:hypothetical protein